MQIKEILKLIESVRQYDIHELEVSNTDWKVRITRQAALPAMPPQGAVESHAASSLPASNSPAVDPESRQEAQASSNPQRMEILSPMVGTFYRASAPDADPFVNKNDVVAAGQVVCIIEAMKLMNEIPTENRGRIVDILVENAQPVEYGQPLFLMEAV